MNVWLHMQVGRRVGRSDGRRHPRVGDNRHSTMADADESGKPTVDERTRKKCAAAETSRNDKRQPTLEVHGLKS